MRVLVTGGAGFIGSHLCEALLERGDEVIAVDSFDELYPRAYKESNLDAVRRRGGSFRFIEADVRDSSLYEQLEGVTVDRIVHLAARAGVRPSIQDVLEYLDNNIKGLARVLEFARERRCGVVFASSSSVYGNQSKVPFEESDCAQYPVSPYAATKRSGELVAYTYHSLYGIPVTSLRFFTVIGPRQRPEMAIHKFTRLIEKGESVPVFGFGKLARDYTFVDDIVRGLLASCDRMDGWKIYNLGNGHPHSLSDLFDGIEKALGRKVSKELLPHQPGDVAVTYADISLARRELDYEPKVSLEEGIARFVQWYREVGRDIGDALERGSAPVGTGES